MSHNITSSIPLIDLSMQSYLILTHTAATLLIVIFAKTFKALFVTGAIFKLAFATLRQHALGYDGGTYNFIARFHHAIETYESQH